MKIWAVPSDVNKARDVKAKAKAKDLTSRPRPRPPQNTKRSKISKQCTALHFMLWPQMLWWIQHNLMPICFI